MNMKKLTGWILAVCFFLTGCAGGSRESAALVRYRSYYNAVSENTEYVTETSRYSLSMEMVKEDENSYSYYIFVDQPRIAMYDVIVMAVENGIPYGETDHMMPSIGIFDGTYSLIPNQVNREDGYVKGLVVSGSSDQPETDLRILVEWKDRYKEKTSRQFHHVILNEEGMRYAEGAAD